MFIINIMIFFLNKFNLLFHIKFSKKNKNIEKKTFSKKYKFFILKNFIYLL